MRSGSIFFTLILVLLQVECSGTLLSLLREKYVEELDRSPKTRTYVNKRGETVTSTMPLPMPLHIGPLINDQGIEKLRNFEEHPDKIVYGDRIRNLIIFHAVSDYDTNPQSRKIINYCLQVNPDPGYIQMLLASAAAQNVTGLIEKLIAIFDLSFMEDCRDTQDHHGKSFTRAIVRSGNYHIAKDLILRGFLLDSAVIWYVYMCKIQNFDHIAAVIDFLDFLIVTTEMLDVNQYILGYPLINFVLENRPNNNVNIAFKRAVAEHLLTLGADPKAKDRYGNTASQYSHAVGINFPK